MTVDLEQHADGVLLPVQVQPKARKNAVTGVHAGRLKVSVTQAPEKGKANVAVIKVLAAALDIKKSKIDITSGQTSSQKKLLLAGVSVEELNRRISNCLPDNPS